MDLFEEPYNPNANERKFAESTQLSLIEENSVELSEENMKAELLEPL